MPRVAKKGKLQAFADIINDKLSKDKLIKKDFSDIVKDDAEDEVEKYLKEADNANL